MNEVLILLLCVNFAWCQLNGENARSCDDCVSIYNCDEAKPYLKPSEEQFQFIKRFYCNAKNGVFNVCCSKLKDSLNNKRHPNLKLLPDNCGNIYNGVVDRIFGGDVSNVFEFPWTVLISYSPNLEFRCSGTLINSRYVLTAAHCVHNGDIAGVRVGEYDIGTSADCKDGVCATDYQDIRVNRIIPHEDYKRFDNLINDIALIRLEENVNLTLLNAGTICLPITEELQSRKITSRFATVAGWGVTEYNQKSRVLLKVKVYIRANEFCQTHYRYVSPSDKTRFCAGGLNRDSCEGDSGGPLMLEDSYKGQVKMIQYGIVSHGAKKCGTDAPGIYTDVRSYVKWILDNIKE